MKQGWAEGETLSYQAEMVRQCRAEAIDRRTEVSIQCWAEANDCGAEAVEQCWAELFFGAEENLQGGGSELEDQRMRMTSLY